MGQYEVDRYLVEAAQLEVVGVLEVVVQGLEVLLLSFVVLVVDAEDGVLEVDQGVILGAVAHLPGLGLGRDEDEVDGVLIGEGGQQVLEVDHSLKVSIVLDVVLDVIGGESELLEVDYHGKVFLEGRDLGSLGVVLEVESDVLEGDIELETAEYDLVEIRPPEVLGVLLLLSVFLLGLFDLAGLLNDRIVEFQLVFVLLLKVLLQVGVLEGDERLSVGMSLEICEQMFNDLGEVRVGVGLLSATHLHGSWLEDHTKVINPK